MESQCHRVCISTRFKQEALCNRRRWYC